MSIDWIRFIDWDGSRKEISLRERCYGGAVRRRAKESPEGILRRSRRVLLLVHGFNVSLCAAEKSYEKFVGALPFRWRGRTLWTYWPGDATISGQGSNDPAGLWSDLWSVIRYSWQANQAEESALVLRDYLEEATNERTFPVRLSIIAHSLGCRLALEFIRLLGTRKNVKLELVILMAAAVPQYLCKPHQRYDLSTHGDTNFIIYYSYRDEVLLGAFRPGQFAAATDPTSRIFGRAAIGRKGLTGTIPSNVRQRQVFHRHGGYWSDRDIAIAAVDNMDKTGRPVTKRFLAPRPDPIGREVDGRHIGLRKLAHSKSEILSTCRCE
jgi:hypothetical protein